MFVFNTGCTFKASNCSSFWLMAGVKGMAGENSQSGASKNTKARKDNALEKKSSHLKRKGQRRWLRRRRRRTFQLPRLQFDDEQRVAKAKRRSLVEETETKNCVELFRHLPQFVHGTQLPSLEAKFFQDDATHPHPAVYQVLLYITLKKF